LALHRYGVCAGVVPSHADTGEARPAAHPDRAGDVRLPADASVVYRAVCRQSAFRGVKVGSGRSSVDSILQHECIAGIAARSGCVAAFRRALRV